MPEVRCVHEGFAHASCHREDDKKRGCECLQRQFFQGVQLFQCFWSPDGRIQARPANKLFNGNIISGYYVNEVVNGNFEGDRGENIVS